MPARLKDTDEAMVISRRVDCGIRNCGRLAHYDVSVKVYWQDHVDSGRMGDWQPMCYRHAKAATEGKMTR